ncbi:MAG: hypothetical protein JW910_09845, partial [Anaerolineae bacterium]|nr:hypothetical protein [Anaerolineae bacterium]
MKTFTIFALLAVMALVACGGGTEIPTAASLPDADTAVPGENPGDGGGEAEAASADQVADSSENNAGSGDTSGMAAAGLPDPASLAVAGFQVTVSDIEGEWTEVMTANHSERSTRGGHRAVTFRLAQTGRESGRILVTLRLALDLAPGTYDIMTDGPVSAEISTSDLGADLDFEENVQGTFWLTAPLDEAITGGFQFTAATSDGQPAQATGAINTLYLEGEGTVTVEGDVSASFAGGVSSAWDGDAG